MGANGDGDAVGSAAVRAPLADTPGGRVGQNIATSPPAITTAIIPNRTDSRFMIVFLAPECSSRQSVPRARVFLAPEALPSEPQSDRARKGNGDGSL